MTGFLMSFFTVVLVLASLFIIFVVLLQRGSEGGAGSAFGGGMAESAFGGETSRVLTRATVTTAIIFFVVGLGLYLGQIASHKKSRSAPVALDAIVASAQAKSDASAQNSTAEQNPPPGQLAREAEKMLAAETKSGAEALQPRRAQSAQMLNSPVASTLSK